MGRRIDINKWLFKVRKTTVAGEVVDHTIRIPKVLRDKFKDYVLITYENGKLIIEPLDAQDLEKIIEKKEEKSDLE